MPFFMWYLKSEEGERDIKSLLFLSIRGAENNTLRLMWGEKEKRKKKNNFPKMQCSFYIVKDKIVYEPI